jgi:hypothetical protein
VHNRILMCSTSKGSTYLLMLRLLKKHKPSWQSTNGKEEIMVRSLRSSNYRWSYVVSDAFFVVGITLASVGALAAVDNTGFFDLVRYSSRRFMDLLLNKSTRPNVLTGGFATYVHRSRRKHEVRYPLLIGAFFLFLSLMVALLAS